jgi:ferric-dicitrate binding protein FerR (iron transport regulator)
MTKEEFQELLQRYKAGRCSSEEIQKINSWFDRIADENLELNDWEKDRVSARMLDAIRKVQAPVLEQKVVKFRPSLVLKIAASFAILIVVGYFVVSRIAPSKISEMSLATESIVDESQLVEHKNSTQGILWIQLPDSSTVELKPNAEISYLRKWNNEKREVHLAGEAFFEVVKDSSRPFYVYGGEIVTKVLGTSFTVNAEKNAESIEVAVRTGKVSVYEDARIDKSSPQGNEASGVILTPNEKVQYFIDDKHWVTSLVAEPKPLPASNKAVDFLFSNASMSDIIKSMERTYSIDIIIENEASYSCTFTGDVSMMELYDMLDVICKSIGTNYEVKGTKILITGSGCQ